MCFLLDYPLQGVMIATWDIIVFKTLYPHENRKYESIYYNHFYEMNVLYEGPTLNPFAVYGHYDPNIIGITHAFHSYNSHIDAIRSKNAEPHIRVIVKCVIPKESQYMVNRAGEVVSNKIKLIAEL